MTDQSQTAEAGPIPTAEQREMWGDDYLWMWCSTRPKEAAAEIERLRAKVSDLDNHVKWWREMFAVRM